jgi:hypothetical protein
MDRNVVNFYKKTSYYTDLGKYKEVAINLPDDIKELCKLQRNQTIHPFDLKIESNLKDVNSFYGDMTKLGRICLKFENDLFPSAISMMAELLRRDERYSIERNICDKIHICCREQSILLTSILKAKGLSARVRSGFCKYINPDGRLFGDHWIVEYYNDDENRWILVDADMSYDDKTLNEFNIDFDLTDIPKTKYLYAADAYLGLRMGKYNDEDIYFASNPLKYGLKAAVRALFYDFHSIMNDEIIFLHLPKYALENNFVFTEEELKEIDYLAKLMLNVEENFVEIQKIWESNDKFRIMAGGFEGYKVKSN